MTREVVIAERAAVAVRRGHPWVFREALTERPTLRTGEEVRVMDRTRTLLGHAWADADSPLALRMWTHAQGNVAIDDALLARRFEAALRIRDRLFKDGSSSSLPSGATTAFRITHGEGDRTPGVVVDRYGHVAVLRLDGAAAEVHKDRLVSLLWPKLEARGVTTFMEKSRNHAGLPPTLKGAPGPERIEVEEHGMRFWVDLAEGQKTGAFLDQRENRRRVRGLAAGRRVLNLFSYAGGFSLSAALGGARQVVSVDIAAKAHKTAQESFRLSGVDPSAHKFVAADAFAWLASAAQRKETFDLIISDPPSFAPNEKSVPRALKAYRDLHGAAAKLLASDGLLCASSCSSHVDLEAFLSTLDDETLGFAGLRAVETFGSPPDHPTLPAFPEGRYLKFVVLEGS